MCVAVQPVRLFGPVGTAEDWLAQTARRATDAHVAGSFEEAVREHRDMVFGLSCRLLGERAEAEDLTQEVFLRAFRAWAGFRGDCSRKTWFYRITLNAARNQRLQWQRKMRRRHAPLEDPGAPGPSPGETLSNGGADPERATRSREIRERVQAGLLELPAEFREAVVLRDVEGLSYTEISEALEITAGTVKSRIARGRAQLREILDDLV